MWKDVMVTCLELGLLYTGSLVLPVMFDNFNQIKSFDAPFKAQLSTTSVDSLFTVLLPPPQPRPSPPFAPGMRVLRASTWQVECLRLSLGRQRPSSESGRQIHGHVGGQRRVNRATGAWVDSPPPLSASPPEIHHRLLPTRAPGWPGWLQNSKGLHSSRIGKHTDLKM